MEGGKEGNWKEVGVQREEEEREGSGRERKERTNAFVEVPLAECADPRFSSPSRHLQISKD